jgi:manganese transport protein
MIFAQHMGDVLYGLIPSMPNETALYIGIIGATVMPHNLLLLWCKPENLIEPEGIKQALKYNFIDSTIALNLAL